MISFKPSSKLQDETTCLNILIEQSKLHAQDHLEIKHRARALVQAIRDDFRPSLMDNFLKEYGLSTQEGVALMCLAEVLLRIPDAQTSSYLIADKVAIKAWEKHISSALTFINAASWGLFFAGKILSEHEQSSTVTTLQQLVKRLGAPIITKVVRQIVEQMGKQFVLGETIESGIKRSKEKQDQGFTYSYDMLGEASKTHDDAQRYFLAYCQAISTLSAHATKPSQPNQSIKESRRQLANNPGISVKLSALYPRYELNHQQSVIDCLYPKIQALVQMAAAANIGLNIDAEEADRLEISTVIIEKLLNDPATKDWFGLGIVVQAYHKQSSVLIDWLYQLATDCKRPIMVRLVKGAYWDTEIKLAQERGLSSYPVFTSKFATDISYTVCAQKLLQMTDMIYPQFATHNALSVATILELAAGQKDFEFQCLHGMGDALYHTLMQRDGTRCRIYAPVGVHKDLLAYLVRRLLENGANSSFVNQLVNENIAIEDIVKSPFELFDQAMQTRGNLQDKHQLPLPCDIFPNRSNSAGLNLHDQATLTSLKKSLTKLETKAWNYQADDQTVRTPLISLNPASGEPIGQVEVASIADIDQAYLSLRPWLPNDAGSRATILSKAADLYQEHSTFLLSLLQREAGKTIEDAMNELREAVDFLRYYASEINQLQGEPAGTFCCISPWNFPLAIFTGQVAAALAAGNGVLAKPAEDTPIVAQFAVELLYRAGVSPQSLKVIQGEGKKIGQALIAHPSHQGVCFTGSTATAKLIQSTLATRNQTNPAFIAETGGINAMVVDSTALLEQAVSDIIQSAFSSAGQRCSALRLVYVQKEIAPALQSMLIGAMSELKLGDPSDFSVDIGPIINEQAAENINRAIGIAKEEGRLLFQLETTSKANYIAPALISVNGFEEVTAEIFGPVLHLATFENHQFDKVLQQVNNSGYGLTFGLHSRIEDRMQNVKKNLNVGNIYINRNQIGAVVGSQPFGGEGLSGTGPKAGGPLYLHKFLAAPHSDLPITAISDQHTTIIQTGDITKAFASIKPVASEPSRLMPGVTGETNEYYQLPMQAVLCLGPGADAALKQHAIASQAGCRAVAIAPGLKESKGLINGEFDLSNLISLEHLDAVLYWGKDSDVLRQNLAKRPGPIVPLYHSLQCAKFLCIERHMCTNTTAMGGNIGLLNQRD